LGGKLAIAWNNLLEEYWNSGTRAGNPSEVKSTVARKVRKFGGFSQQDSNEFMTEFLSILNEDLNRTDKKEYKELKEKDDDETELDCAKRFWNLHVKLNDSIVTDLFSGLFRSEVQCTNSKCRYKNITFDPFDTLTLPIPSSNELFTNVEKIFYVPKYSIGQNCRIKMNIKKTNSSLKNIMENTKNINEFKYNIKKLKYIKVLDEKLIGFMDENENYNPKDYIFVFDDMTKEGEKNNIIPLYFYKDEKISAFPRLLFLEENINFGELKKRFIIMQEIALVILLKKMIIKLMKK
jgi:ubiquitin C-terminal hydrolase